ncbi:MAG: archease [Candidatus Micrarchaeaceae archaeon]
MRSYSAKYRYLPHTAEKAFVAYGSTFVKALENAAEAMLGIMFDIKKIREQRAGVASASISKRARNKEDLVWYALQGILEEVDEKGLNAYAFKVRSYSSRAGIESLKGAIVYKRLRADFSLLDIKAVTPYDLSVKNSARGWLIHVVVDV